MESQVIARDVGDDGHVVVHRADPAQEDAAPRGLEDGDLDARLRERDARAGEAGIVAALDQVVVVIHAVGGRIGDAAARGAHEMREQADRRRLAVRPGHGDDGDRRLRHRGGVTGRRCDDADRRIGGEPRERPSRHEQVRQHAGHLTRERFRRPLPSPREGDDDLVFLRPGAPPYGEPDAGCVGELPGHVCGDLGGEATALVGAPLPGRQRPGGVHLHRHPLEARCRGPEPPGDGDGQRDRRTREVEVGAFERPELDEFRICGHDRRLPLGLVGYTLPWSGLFGSKKPPLGRAWACQWSGIRRRSGSM